MPLDTASAVASLVSDRVWWGNWLDLSTTAVIIGVVGEAVADVSPIARALRIRTDSELRKAVEYGSLILLIVGLLGELLCGIPVANDTASIETTLNGALIAAGGKADAAKGKADAAVVEAGNAKSKAGAAEQAASNAIINAAGATKEAEKSLTGADRASARAANALTSASAARDAATTVQADLARDESQLKADEQRSAQLDAKTEELIRELGPRTLDGEDLARGLNAIGAANKIRSTPVYITHLPDLEAEQFALILGNDLNGLGFNVIELQPSGKRLLPEGAIIENASDSSKDALEASFDLSSALSEVGVTAPWVALPAKDMPAEWEPCVPVNAVLVRVQMIPRTLALGGREAPQGRRRQPGPIRFPQIPARVSGDEACPKKR